MAVIIDSTKDKNSFACRHKFGGVYINGEFMKDGTEVPRSVLANLTDAQRERYTRTTANPKVPAKAKAPSKPKATKATPKATKKKTTPKKTTAKAPAKGKAKKKK